MSKKKPALLREAFKISIEVDGDGQVMSPGSVEVPQKHHHEATHRPGAGGMFERYVDELANESRARRSLTETAVRINQVVSEVVEDLSLREDKREYNAGITYANERVLRSWRAFIREFVDFERRFK